MAGERRRVSPAARKEQNLLFAAEEARKDGTQKEGGEGGKKAVRNEESNVVSGGGDCKSISVNYVRARGCCCKRVFGMGRAALAVISVRRNGILNFFNSSSLRDKCMVGNSSAFILYFTKGDIMMKPLPIGF